MSWEYYQLRHSLIILINFQVDNVGGTQIGHIPRRIAAKLAPFMDNNLHVEGELAGEIGAYEVPLAARLYGPDPASEEGVLLQAEMKQAKLPLNALIAAQRAEKQREKERKEAEKRRLNEARRAAAAAGTGSGARLPTSNQYGYTNQSQAGRSAQPVMQDILEASERFTAREVGRAADEYGAKEELLKNMPSMEKPKSIKTEMLPYQLQALRYLAVITTHM
jgi:SWI/SNF-related matrix-associated actin-dependent regulator of chromatin subfamily A3